MSDEVNKTAMEVTGKVAEALVVPVIKKVVSWFSGKAKPRPAKYRGETERRREATDRRISGVEVRFRKGFWLEYHRRTGVGKMEVMIPLLSQGREDLFQSLIQECRHYRFSDRTSGTTLLPHTFAESAIDLIWLQWKPLPEPERRAVLIVEAIAAHLFAKYNVSPLDRRQKQRRASAG